MNLKLHSTQASRDLWWAPRSTERVRWPLWCREKCQLSQRPIFHYPKSFQKVRRVGERKVLCVSWFTGSKKRRPKSRAAPCWTFSATSNPKRSEPTSPRSYPSPVPPKARALGGGGRLLSLLLSAPPVRNVHPESPALSAQTISCCSAESSLLAPAAAAVRLVTQQRANIAAYRASLRLVIMGASGGGFRNGELQRSGQRTDREMPALASHCACRW